MLFRVSAGATDAGGKDFLSEIDLAGITAFQIGELRVEPSTLTVETTTFRKRLEPRVMQALVALATAADTVVSRDTLVSRCWAGRAVSEDAINRCIAKIRRLAAETCAFEVETVPRIGYRLLEVEGSSPLTIAVLPFENLSGDPSQAYFSDGMAEELRSTLSRIPHLKVVARTSSEAVRNEKAQTAAQVLGVRHILTGSLRRSPSMLRIGVQLVDGRSGFQRWSEDFDYPKDDALVVQSNIALRVAQALRVHLDGTTQQALTVGGTRNATAHDLFLKAALGSRNDTLEGLQHSIGQLDAAIELDPQYAQALALKSATISLTIFYSNDPAQLAKDTNEAFATAKRAVELAPELAAGHTALSIACRHQLRFREALQEIEAAIALPGRDAETEIRYAIMLIAVGRGDAAQKAAARAASLDPLNPYVFSWQAFVFFMAGQFNSALAAARRSLELNPSGSLVRVYLIYSLIMMDRNDEAAAELAELPAYGGGALSARAILAARSGDEAAFQKFVQQLEANWADSYYWFGVIYAQSGDLDTAIEYLKKPVEQRSPLCMFIPTDPLFNPLRSDPRFKEIVRELDFAI